MKNSKYFVLALALSLTLGGVAAAKQAQSATQRLVSQLTLTPEQKTKVDPILEDDAKKLLALRQDASLSPEDRRTKSSEVRKDTDAKLKSVLTDEQWKKLQELKEERKKDKKK